MAKEEWFRRGTWSTQDQTEFFAKLKRARATSRAQYLKIQAHCLADAGLHREALTLLDIYFQDYPGDLFETYAYFQRAQCYLALQEEPSAIEAYRNSIAAERQRPNVGSDVWLIYPEFIAQRKLTALYTEAEAILNEFDSESKLVFPVQKFRYHFLRAFFANYHQNGAERTTHTKAAIAATKETHSGFRYHSKEGLVSAIPAWQAELLEKWLKIGAY